MYPFIFLKIGYKHWETGDVWQISAADKIITLVYIGQDRLLDWEPSSSQHRTWDLKRDGHSLVNLGSNHVLDWHVTTISARIWNYDSALKDRNDERDPFPELPVANFLLDELDESYALISLGGNLCKLGRSKLRIVVSGASTAKLAQSIR